MSPAERRPASERREEILGASMELFARYGLHGVTTRMIADAAGISEALLYRHFKSKEELYAELQRNCLRAAMGAAERLAQMEASTSTLVLAMYFMTRQIIPSADGQQRVWCIKRLMLSSLMDDGEFARGFIKNNVGRFVPKLCECIEAARKAGDLEDRGRHADIRVWLAHHAAVMASNMLLPDRPVVDYGVDRETLIEETVRFGLRGIGLTDAAINRHFVPKTLSLLLGQMMAQGEQTTS